MSLGVAGFWNQTQPVLQKPFDPNALLASVRAVLDRGDSLSDFTRKFPEVWFE